MAISITCTGCETVYPVGEQLIGKTIRCKKCGEMMPVKAPGQMKASAQPVEDDDEPTPRPSKRRRDDDDEDDTPVRPKRRAVAAVRDDEDDNDYEDDDEDDDRPRRGAKSRRDSEPKKSRMPLIVGAVLAVLLLGGGITAAIMMSSDEPNNNSTPPVAALPNIPNAEANPANPIEAQPQPQPAPAKTEVPTPTKTTPAKTEETKPAKPAKVEKKEPEAKEPPSAEPQPQPMPTPMPGFQNVPGIGRGRGGNEVSSGLTPAEYFNGNISPYNMQRATRASVFIKCENDFGFSTGSGWFGMQEGLVFTNAHVIDMLAPNSPPPKKMTFFLNAGTPDQREIPHAKLKILAVDQEIDLAVIQVIGETDLPLPLQIKASSELQLGQNVFTIGYPLGYILSRSAGRTAKEPEVSVRKTSFSGPASNQYGQVRRVKLEGGVNSGNSGGPVIDANGEVVCVVVEVTNGGAGSGAAGNYISLCVPTEYVNGLLAGRVAKLEYGTPYRDQKTVRIPITAQVLNPLDKTLQVRVRGWIGDVSAKFRAPGTFKPKAEPGDANEQDVLLKYDEKEKVAKGELVYPEAPAGRTYWAQPYYTNAFTTESLPGIKIPLNGPPVDRVPANLVANPRTGARRVVTMSNSSSLTENFEGEGVAKSDRVLIKKELKVNEQVIKSDPTDQRQAARLQLQFDSLKLSVEGLDGALQDNILSKQDESEINRFLRLANAYGLINRWGEMYNYVVTVTGVNNPLINLIVNALSNESLEAMQATSIPMPNKQVQPGETWESNKEVRFIRISRPTAPQSALTPGAPPPKNVTREYKYRDQITYTYLGLRERGGRKEAVVKVEGKSIPSGTSKDNVTGSVKGIVWVEIDTGVVVQAELEKEFDLDTSSEGQKKRLSGINTYKLNRGPAQ